MEKVSLSYIAMDSGSVESPYKKVKMNGEVFLKWQCLSLNLDRYLEQELPLICANDPLKKFYLLRFSYLRVTDTTITTNNDLIIRYVCDADIFEPTQGSILSMSIEDIDKKNNFIVLGIEKHVGFKVFVSESGHYMIGQSKRVCLEAVKNRKQDIIAIGRILPDSE